MHIGIEVGYREWRSLFIRERPLVAVRRDHPRARQTRAADRCPPGIEVCRVNSTFLIELDRYVPIAAERNIGRSLSRPGQEGLAKEQLPVQLDMLPLAGPERSLL